MDAIYPGSFDPITKGHEDIIVRAAARFVRLHVIVCVNSSKQTLFTANERVDLIQEVCDEKKLKNVFVEKYDGLVATRCDYTKAVIVKGLRAVSDYEYELAMAMGNKKINDHCETFFIPTSPEYSFLSSSFIREMYRMGAYDESLVSKCVHEALIKEFEREREW